jgi:cell division ATPase FtsA
VIARGGQIFFARTIPIGGDHFCKAVAHALRISADEAKLLRLQLCHSAPAAGSIDDRREKVAVSATKPAAVKPEVEEDAEAAQVPESSSSETVENSFALLGAGLQAASRQQQQQAHAAAQPGSAAAATAAASAHSSVEDELSQQARAVEQACRDPLNRLIEELDLCRRYYEATFPNRPVDRLVFVGGEARQRTLCQHIARELGVTAQVGDPLVRMGRVSDIGIESGIDRRQPQPGWAVAIGLSLGPTAAGGEGQVQAAAVAAAASAAKG